MTTSGWRANRHGAPRYCNNYVANRIEGRRGRETSNERDGNWELYRLKVADGSVVRLTDHEANDRLPAISPDGSQVAFFSNRNDEWALWILPVAGGVLQRLAPLTSQQPDWLVQGIDWTDAP